jgi:hypothetical protein
MLRPLVALIASSGCMTLHAIEAPKQQQTETPPAEQAPAQEIVPTDETEFYEQLQRVAHWRSLRGLKVSQTAIDALARGEADVAVGTLSTAAAQGSEEANIALVRIQHWCSQVSSRRVPNAKEQLAKLNAVLPPERAARAAGVLQAEAAFQPRAAQGCSKANFDYGAIEDRLRDAADMGKPASATELAQFTRDPKKRDALLEAAAEKQYAPAMYIVATRRVIDVQRAERTEDVGSIRLYLKQAGRTMPKAKVDLANCMALGCDGHPADASSAQAFGVDAARDGEPTAFLSMARMPWGRRMPRAQLLAWQYFGDRLNEAGCMGDAYIMHAMGFAQAIKGLTQNADESVLTQAKQQAERLWQDSAARAMNEQGCSAKQLGKD